MVKLGTATKQGDEMQDTSVVRRCEHNIANSVKVTDGVSSAERKGQI